METVNRFNAAIRDATDMGHHQNLLAKAVATITGKTEEKGVENLFHGGGAVPDRDSFQGMDDLEVVSYLTYSDGGERDYCQAYRPFFIGNSRWLYGVWSSRQVEKPRQEKSALAEKLKKEKNQ